MRHPITVALSIVIVLSAGALELRSQATAQSKPRSTSKKPSSNKKADTKAAQQAPTDKNAQKREELKKAIQESCEAIEKAIVDANRSFSKRPFDSLTTAADFRAKCYADGTIGWTARRIGNGTASEAQYQITVTVKVTDLNLGDLKSERGLVSFACLEAKIALYGPTTVKGSAVNLDKTVKDWWIDFGDERDEANIFKQSVRRLFNDLNALAKLAYT